MTESSRRWWHRYVPAHVSNPVPLMYRLLKAHEPAARSALYMAAAGVGLSVFDRLMQMPERRLYEKAGSPAMPIILVCGPPRSGTTLVAQYLINTFEVCYLNNLTSLFPRSPILANRWFGRYARLRPGPYAAYYGKSRGLSDPNDALYVWDRWLGSDRHRVPTRLERGAEQLMPRFFGALETHYGLPVVNKVNRLNTCAHLVAEHLENAWFLCVRRDPLMLAQSLYVAREEIGGDLGRAYGVQHPDRNKKDPVDDVCRQVVFHERQAREQQRLLGERRFRIIQYEEFCERPFALARAVSDEPGGLAWRGSPEEAGKQVFRVSQKQKLPTETFERMRQRLSDLGVL